MISGGGDSRHRLAQLSGLIQEMDQRVSRSSNIKVEAVTSMHLQIASLEGALAQEISKRGELEKRMNESVDAKVRSGMDRLADAVESEMGRLYKKMDADVSTRVDGLSRELAGVVGQKIPFLERDLDNVKDSVRRNLEIVNRIEARVVALEGLLNESVENAKSGMIEYTKSEIVKVRSSLSEFATKQKSEVDLVMNKLDGAREKLLSEISELHAELQSEILSREEADKDLVEVVTQYAQVMQKHIESSTTISSSKVKS